MKLWDKIPLDADITVTHTPPKFHCDETRERRAAGCEALRCRLWRVRPRLAICGHVHEGRSVEVVKWDLGMSNIKYKEIGVERWVDPGENNKKLSLVDLTAKGRKMISNDGSVGDLSGEDVANPSGITFQLENTNIAPSTVKEKASRVSLEKGLSTVAASLLAVPTTSHIPATRGQGGVPPSNRCDLEALSGRMGRKETCVINAAIMASSWPHKGTGGKKFNKPIVVDIDLPVWEEDAEMF
jgi:hypothetical protein